MGAALSGGVCVCWVSFDTFFLWPQKLCIHSHFASREVLDSLNFATQRYL